MLSISERAFSTLILKLYEAAENPERWNSFLSALITVTNAQGAAFFVHDLQTGTASGVHFGYDPAEIDRYFRHYSSVNPWVPKQIPELPVPNVLDAESFLPISELKRTEFYNDWGRRNDVVHTIGVNLRVANGKLLYLSLNRGEKAGPYSADVTDLLTALVPHLERAARIHETLRRRDGLRHPLDAMAVAVLLLDDTGRVLEMSERAHTLIRQRDGLALDSRLNLQATVREADRELRTFLCKVLHAPGPRPSMVRIPRGDDRPDFHLLALRHQQQDIFGSSASISVYVLEPRRSAESAIQSAAELYGLTPAEVRLLHTLLGGETLRSAADKLGVAQSTARSQLRGIFHKTGTHRQSEVIGLFSVLAGVTPSFE